MADEAIIRVVLQDQTSAAVRGLTAGASSAAAGSTSSMSPEFTRKFTESMRELGETFRKSIAPVVDVLTGLRGGLGTRKEDTSLSRVLEEQKQSARATEAALRRLDVGLNNPLRAMLSVLERIAVATSTQLPTSTGVELGKVQLEIYELRKQTALLTREKAPDPATEQDRLKQVTEALVFETLRAPSAQSKTAGEVAAASVPLATPPTEAVGKLQAAQEQLRMIEEAFPPGKLTSIRDSIFKFFRGLRDKAGDLYDYTIQPIVDAADVLSGHLETAQDRLTSGIQYVTTLGGKSALQSKMQLYQMREKLRRTIREQSEVAMSAPAITEGGEDWTLRPKESGASLPQQPWPPEGTAPAEPPVSATPPPPPVVEPVTAPETTKLETEYRGPGLPTVQGVAPTSGLEPIEGLTESGRPSKRKRKGAKQLARELGEIAAEAGLAAIAERRAVQADAAAEALLAEQEATAPAETPSSLADLPPSAPPEEAPPTAPEQQSTFDLDMTPVTEAVSSLKTPLDAIKTLVENIDKNVQIIVDRPQLPPPTQGGPEMLGGTPPSTGGPPSQLPPSPPEAPILSREEEEQKLRRAGEAARDKAQTRRKQLEEAHERAAAHKASQLPQPPPEPVAEPLPESEIPSLELTEDVAPAVVPVEVEDFELLVEDKPFEDELAVETPALEKLERVGEQDLSIAALQREVEEEQKEEEEIAIRSAQAARDMLADELEEKKAKRLAEVKERAKIPPKKTVESLYDEILSKIVPPAQIEPFSPTEPEFAPISEEENEIARLLLEMPDTSASTEGAEEEESATIPLAPEENVEKDILWRAWENNPRRTRKGRRQISQQSYQKMMAAGMPEDTGRASTRGRRTISSEEYEAYAEILRKAGGDPPDFFAHGGSVPSGYGTDTVPAMLTPGEFVVNQRAAAAHRNELEAMNAQRYAEGGPVDPAKAAAKADADRASKGNPWTRAAGSAVGALSSVTGFGADPGSDVSGPINKMGDAASAVGMQMAASVPIIGAAVVTVGELGKAFGGLIESINKTADRYSEYSPEIAQAQALSDINQIMGDFRRSQEISGDTSKFLLAQSDLQQTFEDTKIQILKQILPIATNVLRGIEVVMEETSGITQAVLTVVGAIGNLTSATDKVSRALEDELREAPNDPTDDILKGRIGIPTEDPITSRGMSSRI